MYPSISDELDLFHKRFYDTVESPSDTIKQAIDHLSAAEGKYLRPAILLLTAKCFGPVTDKVIDGAVLVELLHTATLIHDDVVDDTPKRRGQEALHTLLDNKAAVLIGDYLLSSSMYMAVGLENFQILETLMRLGKELSEGELYQLDVSKNGVPKEEQYYEIIKKKTSYLIASCMKIGAILADVKDQKVINNLFQAGIYLGNAFQIRDDMFDYSGTTKEIGKPVGNDLREHKVTLPLIYALENGKERETFIKMLEKEELTSADIETLIHYAIKAGGLDYAQKILDEYIYKAVNIIQCVVPESKERDELIKLCMYVGERTK